MSLSFGWRANDTRESYWRGDAAFDGIPAQALAAWEVDGDGSHLEKYAKHGQPTLIKFRNLTLDETRVVQAYYGRESNMIESYTRAILAAFRIGVSFDGQPDEIGSPDGQRHKVVIRERGIPMLAMEFVEFIERENPGIVGFYGGKIFDASFAKDDEKKASSPPSTPTPSSAEAGTSATTAASPDAGAA